MEEEFWNLSDKDFQEVFRMSKTTVVDLQAEMDFLENTNQDRIDSNLLATLWYLGNTKSFEDAQAIFGYDNLQTNIEGYLLKILKLGCTYIALPKGAETVIIQNSFNNDYKLSGVVGVIGSLLVEVAADKDSSFFNEFTEKHTIVLQVVCDNNLLLRDVCVGCPGGQSIKEIFRSSRFCLELLNENSFLAKEKQIFLAGTEHPKLLNLLTPYKGPLEDLTESEQKFNLLHNSAMNVVQQTFMCLDNRFPRLTGVDELNHELATVVVSAICILHNFTRVRNDNCELYL